MHVSLSSPVLPLFLSFSHSFVDSDFTHERIANASFYTNYTWMRIMLAAPDTDNHAVANASAVSKFLVYTSTDGYSLISLVTNFQRTEWMQAQLKQPRERDGNGRLTLCRSQWNAPKEKFFRLKKICSNQRTLLHCYTVKEKFLWFERHFLKSSKFLFSSKVFSLQLKKNY